jgi:hypothetical protein
VEHDQAEANMTAEKYVLGELRDDEREAFEEHFFSCPECARDMRVLSCLADGARLLPNMPPPAEPSKSRLFNWLSGWRMPSLGFGLAYAGVLLAVTGLAVYEIESRQKLYPQAVLSVVLPPETRGEPLLIPVSRIGQFLLVEADLPGASGTLQWDLRQANSNTILVHDTAAAPPPGASFKVLLPAALLDPSEYSLSVHAASAPPEQAWLFRFRMTKNLR